MMIARPNAILWMTPAVLFALAAPASAQRATDPAAFVEDSIRAEQLDTVVRLRIAMPFEYSADKPQADSFPVLIVLGAGDRLMFTSLVTSLRLLNTPFGGGVPPLIIIGVVSNPASPWPKTTSAMDSLRSGAGGADAFTHFLNTDLAKWIKARFPTRAHTTVAGHSVYGVLSLYAVARSPGIFDAAVAVSPAFWSLDAKVHDTELAQDLADRIGRNGGQRIYAGVGAFDPGPIRDGTAVFANAMKKRAAPRNFEYEVLPDDNHQTSRESGFVAGARSIFRPVSLARNEIYALMGGFGRDLDTLALQTAYQRMKSRYAEGARSLNLPASLPASFLATMTRLSPIEDRNAPIPIFRHICADYLKLYPTKPLPRACAAK